MPYNLSIPGQVSLFQLKAIELTASLVPAHGKVVEVGSLFGCSSWAWSKSVHESVTVYCIDPWEKNAGIRSMEKRLGIKYGLEQFKIFTADCPNIKPLKGYSPRDFLEWSDEIDLYYEDAVHTNPILKSNLDFWSKKIKHSGIICGDDYRPRFPDVIAGAQELAVLLQRELLVVDLFWCLLPSNDILPGVDIVSEKLKHLGEECLAIQRSRQPVYFLGPQDQFTPVAQGSSHAFLCRITNTGVDPLPSRPEVEQFLQIVARFTTDENHPLLLAELRIPLDKAQLEPDIHHDFELPLPVALFKPGIYQVKLTLLHHDGTPVQNNDKIRPWKFTVIPSD